MKKIKTILLFSICLLIAVFSLKTVKADEALIKYAKSAYLIEASTNKELYSYNENKKMHCASMTKILTMKLVLDAINDKRITYDQMLTTSKHAASMDGSRIFLSENEKMSVRDLFKSVAIASANDSAVVLAEAISGTEENFVKLMNQEVKKLGLVNTHFSNCTGLGFENHYSTSKDMAIIASSLLEKYEQEIIPLTSTYESFVRENTKKPFWLVNTNKLIKFIDGVDGLKTGWTNEAGYCLTCTKVQDGMRVISVVMNCENVQKRTIDTVALLDYAYANFFKVTLFKKGTVVKSMTSVEDAPVTTNVIVDKDINLILPKGKTFNKELLEYKVEIINKYDSKNFGKIIVYYDKEEINNNKVIPSTIIKRASFFSVFMNLLDEIF